MSDSPAPVEPPPATDDAPASHSASTGTATPVTSPLPPVPTAHPVPEAPPAVDATRAATSCQGGPAVENEAAENVGSSPPTRPELVEIEVEVRCSPTYSVPMARHMRDKCIRLVYLANTASP